MGVWGAEPPREKKLYFNIKYIKCFNIKNILWVEYLKILFQNPIFGGGGYPKTFFQNLIFGGGYP